MIAAARRQGRVTTAAANPAIQLVVMNDSEPALAATHTHAGTLRFCARATTPRATTMLRDPSA